MLYDQMESCLESCGVRLPGYTTSVVQTLFHGGAQSISELAQRLKLSHQLASQRVKWLIGEGLATMDPGGRALPGFVRRIKPYCEIPERESALHAYLTGLEFQSLPCPYASEAMRNDIRDFLNRMEDRRPGTKFTVYRTALKLAPQAYTQTAGHCRNSGEPTTNQTCRTCQLLEQLQKKG